MVAAACTLTQPWPGRGPADAAVIAMTRAAQLNSRYVTGFRCRRARTPADMVGNPSRPLGAPNWLVWVTRLFRAQRGPQRPPGRVSMSGGRIKWCLVITMSCPSIGGRQVTRPAGSAVVSTTSFDHWTDQRAGLRECAGAGARRAPSPRRPVLGMAVRVASWPAPRQGPDQGPRHPPAHRGRVPVTAMA